MRTRDACCRYSRWITAGLTLEHLGSVPNVVEMQSKVEFPGVGGDDCQAQRAYWRNEYIESDEGFARGEKEVLVEGEIPADKVNYGKNANKYTSKG